MCAAIIFYTKHLCYDIVSQPLEETAMALLRSPEMRIAFMMLAALTGCIASTMSTTQLHFATSLSMSSFLLFFFGTRVIRSYRKCKRASMIDSTVTLASVALFTVTAVRFSERYVIVLPPLLQ